MNLKSKAISEIRATIKTLAAKLENVEDAQISERIEALNYLLGDLLTEQGGKGVPTEQEIKNASKAHYMQYDGEYDSIAVADKAFNEAAQWAISQMQPEWVAITDVWKSKESVDRFNNTSQSLIMVLFDNGDIVRWIDEHPFAEITHVHFLPQPPTK